MLKQDTAGGNHCHTIHDQNPAYHTGMPMLTFHACNKKNESLTLFKETMLMPWDLLTVRKTVGSSKKNQQSVSLDLRVEGAFFPFEAGVLYLTYESKN